MLRGSVRQIQSRAFPACGAEIWAVYAGLCTLVHDKKRGGWSASAGQASLRCVDNQGHATRRLEVFERCQAYGSAGAVFGEKGAAPQERRPTGAFMAGRGSCRAGRVQELRFGERRLTQRLLEFLARASNLRG